MKRKTGDREICRYCGQDVEWHGRAHGWIDRGGNRSCAPFLDFKAGEVKRPRTKHRPEQTI